MRKFVVIALSVGGLNNRIFNCGDIVQENNFPPGRADELVKQKFLKPEIIVEEQIEQPTNIVSAIKTQLFNSDESEDDADTRQHKKRGRKPNK